MGTHSGCPKGVVENCACFGSRKGYLFFGLAMTLLHSDGQSNAGHILQLGEGPFANRQVVLCCTGARVYLQQKTLK